MFSGLFCGYAVLRALHPEIFLYAHHYLSVPVGALNTIVLIFSSFTMAWAVRAAQFGQTKLLVRLLSITLACAFIFLGVKFVEYKNKWEEALLPGKDYQPQRAAAGRDHSRRRRKGKKRRRPSRREGGQPGRAEAAQSRRAASVSSRPSAPAAIGPTGLSPAMAGPQTASPRRHGTGQSRTTCSSSSASTSP